MAAVTLVGMTPAINTLPSTALKARRIVMPEGYQYLRIYSTSDCYLERIDTTDGADRAASYETVPAGVSTIKYIGRGECGISGADVSQVIEITAIQES